MPLPSSAFETHDACRLYRIPGIGQKTSVRKTRSGSLPFNAAWYTHSHNSFLFFSGKAIWNDSCLFYFHSNFDPNQSVQFWISWREVITIHLHISSVLHRDWYTVDTLQTLVEWMNEEMDEWIFFFLEIFYNVTKTAFCWAICALTFGHTFFQQSWLLHYPLIILNHIFTPFLGFCVSLNFPLPI